MVIEISKERAVELIEKVAVFLATRRMAAPAMLFIESFRPLHFVGSQIMYLVSPFASVIFSENEFEEFAALISEHENIKLLLKRIDELDEQMHREQREIERIKRKKFWTKLKSIFKKKTKLP